MDNFDKLKHQVRSYIFLLGGLTVVIMVGGSWLARQMYPHHDTIISLVLLVVGLIAVWGVALILTDYSLKPLETVWRAILHVTPGHTDTTPPNLYENKIGQELVTTLALQIYQLASTSEPAHAEKASLPAKVAATQLADNLPLPVLAINEQQIIIYANQAASKYLALPVQEILQKNLYSVMDLMFSDESTLDTWLKDCRANKAKDTHAWQHIRLKLADQTTLKQFDMAAAYSKADPDGTEMLLTLFDQTERYTGEDNELGFIAMAVHELRTPLTALRGYIEIFDEELGDKLDPEMAGFMEKMQASAKQLTAFVSNILNVARIQEGQQSLRLTEENWASIVQTAAENLSLPAKLRNITINYSIDPQVPAVGVDKISISEVLNNLLDNAIKYSGESTVVTIQSRLTTEGLVETTVTDHGVGIPAAVIPSLFEKFHRNHHNQARISGTGLGLYLCSALVKAHGGNIWIKSKEGQGTAVSFTVQPYASLAGNLKDSDNKDITRNAHGWIKNHSLYRR